MNNEVINSLLTKKKHWKRKQDFYHVLLHKYQRRSNISAFVSFLNYLFAYISVSLKLTKNRWITMPLLVLALVSLFFYIYFSGYSYDYNRKLEKTVAKIHQINEQLIEIMVSRQITNPTS